MRSIDADALERVLDMTPCADIKNIDGQAYVLVRLSQVLNIVKNAPTIEPERKKGEWTKDNSCPFCGFLPWYERDIHTLSFCPNCGADMRGEQNED